MATFSENQVRHLYVVKASKGNGAATTEGEIVPKATKEKDLLWFSYRGVGNNLVTSDKIKKINFIGGKATGSDKMTRKLSRYKVTLAPEGLATGLGAKKLVSGQDYILRLAFTHYVGMTDADQYWKYGMVHATSAMTEDSFYKTLALSLVNNLAREESKLVKVYVHSASKGGENQNATTDTKFTGGYMEVTPRVKDNGLEEDTNPYYVSSSTLVDDIDSIEIEQVAQPWILGTMSDDLIPFTVTPATINNDGDELIWGNVTKVTPKVTLENGHMIADLEYFCMGERGDQYRNIGWPNVIKTTYLVEPEKKYDTLDITYYYAGDNEDIQKSQKTITIVAENTGSHEPMNTLIGHINTAFGVTITTIV